MTTKCRLYPEPAVEAVLREHCAQERFVVNLAIEQYEFALRSRPYRIGKRQSWPSLKTRSADLTELRRELPWLAAGSRTIQNQALRIVDQAYLNWWRNPAHFGRPTFRRRSDTCGFRVVGAGTVFAVRRLSRKWASIRLPKTPEWVRFRITRSWGEIEAAKSARITLDRAGRWHITFPAPQPVLSRTRTGAVVGIDRGVTSTIATSDGAFGHIGGLTPSEAERFLRLERQLARRRMGSNRRERTRQARAKLLARAGDRRRDWIEKSTTAFVSDYDVIAIERLQIRHMVKSARGTISKPGTRVAQKKGLNRSIHEAAWGHWATRLRQKAETCGVLVIEVPASDTSRRCAACGYTASKNRKSQAVFRCETCGHQAHADTNAAVNILRRGIDNLTAAGHAVAAQGDLQALAGSVNCEPPDRAAA